MLSLSNNSLIGKLIFIFCVIITSCQDSKDEIDNKEIPLSDPMSILHISHTRTDTTTKVPEILRSINFHKYDQLWHGGDVDHLTSSNEAAMDIWSAIFRFDAITTHWSLGNHDTSNRTLIEEYTGRSSFYAHTSGGVTILNLDTQLDSSRISGAQLELVNAVCDTISESGVLVVLSHKLLWMPGNDDLEPIINNIVNYIFGNCNSCTQPNNFYQDVYPRLLEVKDRGISVLCIAGDIGDNSKEFEHQTNEGIHFIASGIDVRHSINKAIVLEYQPELKEISWRYEVLENL